MFQERWMNVKKHKNHRQKRLSLKKQWSSDETELSDFDEALSDTDVNFKTYSFCIYLLIHSCVFILGKY